MAVVVAVVVLVLVLAVVAGRVTSHEPRVTSHESCRDTNFAIDPSTHRPIDPSTLRPRRYTTTTVFTATATLLHPAPPCSTILYHTVLYQICTVFTATLHNTVPYHTVLYQICTVFRIFIVRRRQSLSPTR